MGRPFTTLVLLAVLSTISFNTGIVSNDWDQSCTVYPDRGGTLSSLGSATVESSRSHVLLNGVHAARRPSIRQCDAAIQRSILSLWGVNNNNEEEDNVEEEQGGEVAAPDADANALAQQDANAEVAPAQQDAAADEEMDDESSDESSVELLRFVDGVLVDSDDESSDANGEAAAAGSDDSVINISSDSSESEGSEHEESSSESSSDSEFELDTPINTVISSNTGRVTRSSSSSSSTSPRFPRTRNRQDTTRWDRSTRRRTNNGGRPNGGRSNGHLEITNDGRGRWVPAVAAAGDSDDDESLDGHNGGPPNGGLNGGTNGGLPAFGAPFAAAADSDAAVAIREQEKEMELAGLTPPQQPNAPFAQEDDDDSISGMGGMGSPRRRGRRNRNNGDEDSDADEQAEVPIKNQEDDMSEGEQDQADQVAMAEQMKEDEMAMKQQSNCTDSNLLDTLSPELQEEIDSNLPLAEGARYRNEQRHHTGEVADADIFERAGSTVTLKLPGSVSSSAGPTSDQVNEAVRGALLSGERLERVSNDAVTHRGIVPFPNGVVDFRNERILSRYWISSLGRLVSIRYIDGEWVMYYIIPRIVGGYIFYFTYLESGRGMRAAAHRLVAYTWWGIPDDGKPHVDHRNRNRRDNFFRNLAWVSIVANMANKGMMSNNTSGVTGVHYNKKSNTWEAKLTVNGTIYRKGFYCGHRGKNNIDAFNRAVAYRRLLEEMRDNMNL